MKKLTLVFLLAAFFGFAQFSKAQSLAHVNSLELLDAMPEKAKADNLLKTLAAQKKAEIKKQEDDFAAKYKKIQDDLSKKSQPELEKMKTELQKIQDNFQKDQQNLAALQETAGKELDQKQQELYAPILKKAQEAINAVAKAKGYTYVFDSSQGVLLYTGGTDILDAVKANLGITGTK